MNLEESLHLYKSKFIGKYYEHSSLISILETQELQKQYSQIFSRDSCISCVEIQKQPRENIITENYISNFISNEILIRYDNVPYRDIYINERFNICIDNNCKIKNIYIG